MAPMEELEASSAPLTPPSGALAEKWFSPIISDLEDRSRQFQTDLDMVDEELMELFAQEIRRAASGLEESTREQDENGIREHAHTLQGMGGTAGVPEISVVGEQLSEMAKKGDYVSCNRLVLALRGWEKEWIAPETTVRDVVGSLPELSGTLLVVDDELANRRFLEKLLGDCGATVLLAENGERAIELIRSHHPDVALVDVMMPGISGYEVCKRVTRDPELNDTSVIIVTAKSTVEDIEHAFVQGAFDYIRKPYHSRELVARVRNALQLKRQNDALKEWKGRMSRELEVAGVLQSRLFEPSPLLGPTWNLRVAYQPSQHIGGDMFDLRELNDHIVFAYIADVAGHGVASALISTLLKALITEVLRGLPPDAPLFEVANRIHRSFRSYVDDPELYATMQMIRVNTQTGSVEGFCCGHPPMLLFSEEGHVRDEVIPDHGGFPIGMLPLEMGDPYVKEEQADFQMPSGGHLFIYSDGLIEARDSEGEECEREGLIQAVTHHIEKDNTWFHPENVLTLLRDKGYQLGEDDCSLMHLHLPNPGELIGSGGFAPTYEGAEQASNEVNTQLIANGWPELDASMVRLLAMEHAANLADHSGLPESQLCTYRLTRHRGECQLLFRDQGPPWDHHNFARKAESRVEDGIAESGRGLEMISKIAYHIERFRRDKTNVALYAVKELISETMMADEEGS